MATVFLSYSTKDHHFAELATLKLDDAGINVWRDQGRLQAGSEWRPGIERGIAESIAVVVALSKHAVESPYVTFEWAYGLGKGKTVVPLKLEECNLHTRLEPIQHLDFSVPGFLPWELLITRIRDIEANATSQEDLVVSAGASVRQQQDPLASAILSYLDQEGYQVVSYERLRQRLDVTKSDREFKELVDANPSIFRDVMLKGGRPGIGKRIP